MARKKRRKPQAPAPHPPPDDRFHTPFRDLKQALTHHKTSAPKTNQPRANMPEASSKPAPSAPPQPVTPPPSPSRERQRRIFEKQETALFFRAMADVVPLSQDPRGRIEKSPPPRQRTYQANEEEAGLADLRDFIEGRSAFTLQYTDEYMEGTAPGVDQRLAKRLHQGDYTIYAQLDLHGYTVDEAKVLVERFLTTAYKTGQRCVRLIHGRGRNSKDNRPILKEHVQLWLSHGRLSRLVLAFATAPAHDGGAGAAYVLLRRSTRSQSR